MMFLVTPHPANRTAIDHPLSQGERDSHSSSNSFLCHDKNTTDLVRITSPLVGEVARSRSDWAGEGYLKIFQNFKSYPKILYFVSLGLSMQIPFALKADSGISAHSFFQRKAEGWHWYQDSDQKTEIREQNELGKRKELSPTEQIETQRKNLETKLHTAIITPTRENLIAYITTQKALMDQSQKFSEIWKQVVMTTPSLDETLQHPVDQNALHVYYTAYHNKIKQRIIGLAQEYGLFFFFRNNCPYCHQFAPVVKRFSERYGWSVLGISLDGGKLPEFPNAKQNNGIVERLQITHVPALIALHPKTGQLIPLAYGMISESEIEQRIEVLTKISEGLVPGAKQ